MTHDYRFSVPKSRETKLESAHLDAGIKPAWERYPEDWLPGEEGAPPYFYDAVNAWRQDAANVVTALRDVLFHEEPNLLEMPSVEFTMTTVLERLFDDLRSLLSSYHDTWMYDPAVLAAREREGASPDDQQ